MGLKGKRILITAGATSVPVDRVRVISNIATGETGVLIAKAAKKLGAKVTLCLSRPGINPPDRQVKLIAFTFFEELRSKVIKELRSCSYDIIIHSAAVSDFKPRDTLRPKLDSDRAHNLKLVPLPKIIDEMKVFSRGAKIVIFKLEPGLSDRSLIRSAKSAQKRIGADIVVANRIDPYRAFIINRCDKVITVKNKKELTAALLKIIAS